MDVAGAEIMDKGGAGAENKSFWLRNTAKNIGRFYQPDSAQQVFFNFKNMHKNLKNYLYFKLVNLIFFS